MFRTVALLTSAATVVLSLSACGGDTTADPGATGNRGSAPAGAPAAATFNDADVAFVQQMIPHHQSAVAMAAMVDGHAGDARVTEIAHTIRAAQQPEIDTMTRWLTAWGKPAPIPSGDAMEGMDHGDMAGIDELDMAALMNAKGTPWDKEFLAVMVKHHEGAVIMARQEIGQGVNPDARALAEKIITDQQAEISTMKQIRAGL